MPTQPVPNVKSDDVERLARRDFPPGLVAHVLAILERYGGREPDRVRAAALKLAGGDIERLSRVIDLAATDYRDVLAPAEYPGYLRLPPGHEDTGDPDAVIDADWRQYEAWFTRH